jgi:hypothetical protein
LLDLGCGTGALTAKAHEQLGTRIALGLDSSAAMLSAEAPRREGLKHCSRCLNLLAESQQKYELSGWPSVTDSVPRPSAPAKQADLPGVNVTRNFVGKYRVELPMMPSEVARRLEQVREGEPWVVLRRELSIAVGNETRLEVSHMTSPVLVMDESGRTELINALDTQREPELEYEPWSTTFVFKPLVA